MNSKHETRVCKAQQRPFLLENYNEGQGLWHMPLILHSEFEASLVFQYRQGHTDGNPVLKNQKGEWGDRKLQ